MNKIRHAVTVRAVIELDEPQLRALDALAGYGTDGFLKVFYKQMGKHYLQPHEAGLRALFETIKRDVPPALHSVDRARDLLDEDDAAKAEAWAKRVAEREAADAARQVPVAEGCQEPSEARQEAPGDDSTGGTPEAQEPGESL